MDAETKKALERLDAAIGKVEARYAEAAPAPAAAAAVLAGDGNAPSSEVMAEIAAIRGIVDEAISLLTDGSKTTGSESQ